MPKKMKDLIEGYKVFKESYFSGDQSLYQNLSTEGQKPRIIVIACSDSRVDPALVLNCKPGDLFVIRNVANLVPPCEYDNGYHSTSAALEFAVCHLDIKHIIVFGHTQCGGIGAMLQNNCKIEQTFISRWMQLAQVACTITKENYSNESLEEQIDQCAKHAIVNSIENLKTFPWIHEKLLSNTLFIHGWIFNITTGTLEQYDNAQKVFAAI